MNGDSQLRSASSSKEENILLNQNLTNVESLQEPDFINHDFQPDSLTANPPEEIPVLKLQLYNQSEENDKMI